MCYFFWGAGLVEKCKCTWKLAAPQVFSVQYTACNSKNMPVQFLLPLTASHHLLFPQGWWAGLGSAKGGVVIAGQGCSSGSKEPVKVKANQCLVSQPFQRPKENKDETTPCKKLFFFQTSLQYFASSWPPLFSQAVRPHEGTLLLLDAAEEPGRVLQWFLRMHSGRPVAGRGCELEVNFEDMAATWAKSGMKMDEVRDIWQEAMDLYRFQATSPKVCRGNDSNLVCTFRRLT